MCAVRLQSKLQPIDLDLIAAFDFERGIGRAEFLAIATQLDGARKSLLSTAVDGKDTAIMWPQRCLEDYKRQRKSSELGRILHLARQLRDAADRIVVLGPPAVVSTARALFAACCHPHHNELSRGQRGGRPRIYFLPAQPDNDAAAALLEILPRERPLHSVEDRWGIIALDACPDDAQLADLIRGLFLHLWDALQLTTTADVEARLAAAVGLQGSPLLELGQKIGLDAIVLRSGLRCPTSDLVLQPGTLLAGSVMGIDVVNLLRGAAAMTDRFTAQPVGANPAVDFAGLRYLLAQRGMNCGRRNASSASALEPLAQCLHADSGGDHLLVQWIVENHRHDRLQISMLSGKTLDGQPKTMTRQLAELARERFDAVRSARAAAGQPTMVVRLPTIDEASIGQLIQMFSLASAVKRILIGEVSRLPTPDSRPPNL
jgi:glucose-6-phosphate isomerase